MVSSHPTKTLVGISLKSDVSKELLSWAIGLAARPNDTIVALHIVVNKDSRKKLNFDRTQFRVAKAFVISLLGELSTICQSKQVNLEAKVVNSSSIVRGLIDEAALSEAAFLVVGSSRNQNGVHRSSLDITKFCLAHAPKGCSVISIGIGSKARYESDSKLTDSEGLRRSSSRGSSNDSNKTKRLFGSTFRNKSNQNSLSQTSWNKPSPRAVLDGPYIEDDSSSFGDSSITESPPQVQKYRSRSKIWKSLSTSKLLFPFFHSSFDGSVKEGRGSFSDNENRQSSRCFSYEEISKATNNFHQDNMVGEGGYSVVYRGDLCDGQTIAVKRLTKDGTDGNKQKEFLMELGILGHVCHPNTAYLVGYCIENGFYLVFDFSANGNLASALHDSCCNILEWSDRYRIALGVAKGLHYLHKCCKHRIIHRDIKASNVLLGPDFEPQITDFGLAKWLPKQWTHHTVFPIEGTFGYLAPEYFMHGIVDEKTDVFAFGVLLLEIITGREPIDLSKQNLLSWAKPLIDSEDITGLVDPRLKGQYDVDQVHRLVLTASYCVRQSSVWRPSIDEVLQLLANEDLHSEFVKSWRMPSYVDDEMDDYTTDIENWFPADHTQ